MRRRLLAVLQAAEDAFHDVRYEHFLRVGPLYVTTFQRHFDAVRNGFEIGRDYERGRTADK